MNERRERAYNNDESLRRNNNEDEDEGFTLSLPVLANKHEMK
jgi:hypothetical protein